jgi:DNA-binding response OmpR family regulator
VTVHIRRLREKIEADASLPRRLETVWGVGYRFNA